MIVDSAVRGVHQYARSAHMETCGVRRIIHSSIIAAEDPTDNSRCSVVRAICD